LPPRSDEHAIVPAEAPELPQKTFEELVVAADSVIGLQSETNVTSERARVEDRVEARVSRDVRVHDVLAIPAGSRALGTVVSVERGNKFRDRARLGIRFNTLVLTDGTRIPISTDTIYREGDAPGRDSATKMTGAAVGGAILGAILGGGKGAAIGGAVGAGAGAAGVMASDRSQAVLRSGEPITVRMLSPVTVTIEQK
jgi:type IV secretory pathway VirB10-like protein